MKSPDLVRRHDVPMVLLEPQPVQAATDLRPPAFPEVGQALDHHDRRVAGVVDAQELGHQSSRVGIHHSAAFSDRGERDAREPRAQHVHVARRDERSHVTTRHMRVRVFSTEHVARLGARVVGPRGAKTGRGKADREAADAAEELANSEAYLGACRPQTPCTCHPRRHGTGARRTFNFWERCPSAAGHVCARTCCTSTSTTPRAILNGQKKRDRASAGGLCRTWGRAAPRPPAGDRVGVGRAGPAEHAKTCLTTPFDAA